MKLAVAIITSCNEWNNNSSWKWTEWHENNGMNACDEENKNKNQKMVGGSWMGSEGNQLQNISLY